MSITKTPRIGSLCSGYGGLTLAVQNVLGGRVAWHSEYEPPTKKNPKPSQAAARVLEHRFPGVPNLGDMTAIDWAAVEPVEILEGGTPCQDVSHAGPRTGMRTGTRSGLWLAMADAIDVLRPRLVVWENVRGVLSAGADSALEPCPVCMGDGSGDALRALGRVLGDLADLGYDAQWCGLPASAVGAPHGRFRVFVVAHPNGGERDGGEREARGESVERAPVAWGRRVAGGGEIVAHPADVGYERPWTTWGRGDGSANRGDVATDPNHKGPQGTEPARRRDPSPGGSAANAHSDGLAQLGRVDAPGRDADGRGCPDVAWGPYEPAIRRWERISGRKAPHPRMTGARGAEQLAPVFSEWMMGLPAGWVTDVPGITRIEQLKMLGNGVVPQQATAALRHLLGRDG
jgi:DNA (cytosine-5)-methyltransferase 1